MTLPPAIAALAGRTPELVDLLEAWSNINSGSSHAAGLDRMRVALRETFRRAFPQAQIEEPECPGTVHALRVSMRPAAPFQIFLSGHYDTVFEARDPFQRCVRVDARTLRGPGVIDMKGGIVAMLAALEAFEQTPHAANVGWEALLTPDEETGSQGSAPLFVAAARRHHFALVFEPARPNGDIVRSRKGTGGVVVTARGRAAHAARIPNDGRNAILALAEFLLGAARIPEELPGVLVNVGNIRGGGPATNVVPDFAEAELDTRITQAGDRERLVARLNALAAVINARDGYKLEFKITFNRPPKECLPLEERVFAAWQQAAADLGVAPFTWVHTGGASDGNLLCVAGLPNLDGVGPLGDQLHSDREYINITSIASRAQIAALFLHRVATGEVALT